MFNLNPEGRYYHTHWMSRHRIPMLPWWLVGWFVGPLLARRKRWRDGDPAKEFAERHDVKSNDDSRF